MSTCSVIHASTCDMQCLQPPNMCSHNDCVATLFRYQVMLQVYFVASMVLPWRAPVVHLVCSLCFLCVDGLHTYSLMSYNSCVLGIASYPWAGGPRHVQVGDDSRRRVSRVASQGLPLHMIWGCTKWFRDFIQECLPQTLWTSMEDSYLALLPVSDPVSYPQHHTYTRHMIIYTTKWPCILSSPQFLLFIADNSALCISLLFYQTNSMPGPGHFFGS